MAETIVYKTPESVVEQLRADLARVTEERDTGLQREQQKSADYLRIVAQQERELTAARAETTRLRERVARALKACDVTRVTGDALAAAIIHTRAALTSDPEPTT